MRKINQSPGSRQAKNSETGEVIKLTPRDGLRMIDVADVEPESIDWLWKNRLAFGKTSLLVGDPGVGKTTLLLDIAARITAGSRWPDGGKAVRGSVIILSAEDGVARGSIADTIRPRLEAAGADLSRGRVRILQAAVEDGRKRTFNLQDDLVRLRREVRSIGDVVLIGIDPITSYLGRDVDSHRTADIRRVMEPLSRLGDELGIVILAISHTTKAVQKKAIFAATGSLAFVAVARTFFLATKDPDDHSRCLLLSTKTNIGALPEGLSYRLETTMISKTIETTKVVWGDPVNMTADEAIAAKGGGVKRNEAEEFLLNVLADGPVEAGVIERRAEAFSISPMTLRRAVDQLKIVKTKRGFQGNWEWSLPQ